MYGLACVSVAGALLVTLLSRPNELVTPVFFLAIMLSAWFGGIGPGLLAALLATLAIAYYFLPPLYSLQFDPANVPHLLVFFLSAVLVSSWSAARKRAETLLRRARDEQEATVQERTADLNQANETLRERADLLDLTHDTVFVRDMRDVITYWNRGAVERYGWQKAESVGQVSHRTSRTHSHKALNLLAISFMEHIDLKNNETLIGSRAL
jgi:K+-sensing histidine kinase KdpD